MSIQAISFDHLLTCLKESIEIGKKHYLVLVIGSAIMTASNQILALTSVGGLFNPILSIMWTVGIIFVAQTIIEKKSRPQVPQYFVAFSKISLFKALIPVLVVMFVISFAMLILFGIFAYLFYLVFKPGYVSNQLTVILTSLAFTIISLPMHFLPYLVILQQKNWKEALKESVVAMIKNKALLCVYIIPPTAMILIATLTVDMSGKFTTTLVSLLLAPFITLFTYLVYKRIFQFGNADVDIESVKH